MASEFETGLERDFEDRSRSRREEPQWLKGRREEAWRRFCEVGLPTTRDEEWRYTSVDPLKKISFRAVTSPVVSTGAFVQGLPAALAGGSGSMLESSLGSLVDPARHPFASLNTALFQDLSLVYLPAGQIAERPIEIVHEGRFETDPAFFSPRSLIILEPGSQAAVVEVYRSRARNGGAASGAPATCTNAVTEVFLGEGSILEHYKIQEESPEVFHISNLQVRQAAKSVWTSHVVSLGAAFTRNDLGCLLDAEGACCSLNGLQFVDGHRHVDNQTVIDHAHPRGTSQELYKGILTDQATGVFNGRILVRASASKTNARQVNKNLILSEEAVMNSKPLLEILNNDVKCNHGATIGRLDEKQLFYLRTRGLAEAEARGLLTYAFASELVGRMKVGPIRERLRGLLFQRFVRGMSS